MALDDELEFKLLAYNEEIPEFYSLTTCAEAEKHPERVTKAYLAFAQVDQDNFRGVRLKNGFLLPAEHTRNRSLFVRLFQQQARTQISGQGEKYLIKQTYREKLDCKLVSKPKSGKELEKDDCLIALAYAAEHDDVKEVQELVEEAGKDILRTRMPFAYLGTILHVCTNWASTKTLAMVLGDYPESVDVNILDKDGDTALHNLPNTRVPKTYEFCKEAARLLLPLDGDNGKQLLSKTNNYGGLTALHKALAYRCKDVCRALLHVGKDVYCMEKQEKEVPAASSSPTQEASKDAPHWLALTGRGWYIAYEYKDKDVDWNHACCTALHFAVLKEYGEIVKMILEFPGADGLNLTSQPDHSGNTPLHLAARVGNSEICSMLLIQISMRETNKDGASAVTSVNKDGETSLHIASTHGHVEVCELLLKYDSASLSMRDNHGRYALTNALARDKPKVVRILLDACLPPPPTSTQPNSKSKPSLIKERFEFGLTPLHVAVAISSTDHISRLIEADASLGSMSADSRTPLHIASQQYEYRQAFSTLLKAAGKKLNGQGPIRDGQKGWINMRDSLGKTALHNVVMLSRQSAKHQSARCSKRERSEMEMPDEGNEMLEISDGESVTLQVPDGEVVRKEICEMVSKLLTEGAWVDVQDCDGETALHEAMRGHIDIVGTLLSARLTKHNFRTGIDNKDKWIAMSDFSGETALHEAVRTGQVEFVEILLESTQSCDDLVRVRDMDNKTAMDYAALSGYHDMMDVMMKKVEKTSITKEFLIWNLKKHTNPHVHRRYCRKYEIEENQTELLKAAVEEEDVDIARELINKGADVTSLEPVYRHWLAHNFGKKASDQPTLEDTLGRKELVQGVAALLLNPYTQTPITIGIFGSWGTGKSSFMLQVEESMLHMAVKETFRKIPDTLSHDKGSSELKFSKRGAILRRMVDKALKKHKTEADEYNQSDRIFILLAKIITVAQRLSIPSTDIESQNTSKEVDNMKESRYCQFFEDMESTHVQKWDTNTINNCPQSEYEQLFKDLASIDKHKPAYDNRKNSSKKFHSTYRQLFNQLASTNIQELGKDINNWMEVQRKYHQLFKDLASIDKLEYRDWINDFRMELQSNYDQLLRDLALTDRSKLVCSHEGSWFKRKNAYEIGYTPAVLTMHYNAWQYDNKIEASAGLAVEISHQLESFMTPHQWLRMCWKFSWKRRPRDTFLHLLLPAFLALVAACVMVLFWKLVPIATKFKAISLPTSIVGVMWALFQTSLKAIQPVTQFMLSRTKSIDHQSMLGYQHQVIDDIKFLKDQLCQDAHFGWKILSIFCRLFISNTYFMDDTWIWKQHPHLNNLRIVVFIDDLDRCDENTILEVLRAISLILGSCGINVVIGVDKGMVERAITREFLKDNGDKVLDILAKNKDIKIVSKKHEDLEEVESVDKLKTDVKETNLQKVEIDKNENKHDYIELAENYLEKIIQVPIQMPHPSKKHIERFVQGQVGDHLTRLQKAQKRKQKENMRVEDKPAKNEGNCQRQEDEVKDKGSAEIQEVIEEGSEEDHVMNEEDSQGHVKLEDGASDTIVFRSLLANYTPMEKDMFGRLCQLVTKEQRVPREWKRFLTYHRLAWTIFSQDRDMRSQEFKGWQRKLILWIFICWNWRDQMDVVFENWHAIISKSSQWKAQIYLSKKEDKNDGINLKLCDIINIYMETKGWKIKENINPNTGNKGDVKVPKDWIDLHYTLKEEYDIPMHFIEKFQQFRFYCKLNHLEIDEQYKPKKVAHLKSLGPIKSALRLGY